jgi:ribosomal protein S12 methylthiotransferase accessory factor
LNNYPFLVPNGRPAAPVVRGSKFGPLDNTRKQVDACVEIARQAGLDFLVLDQTRPDVETSVVRVVVPGLRHFYRRFGPGRLYDIPVKLGLRDAPITEGELTQYLPHS